MSSQRLGRLRPCWKVWLEAGRRPVFGDGKCKWLEVIERTGSLRAAADAIGISYRGLWGRLREMEQRLGVRLVTRRTGGKGGGGAELTDTGRELLLRYRRFRAGLDQMVQKRFRAAFGRK